MIEFYKEPIGVLSAYNNIVFEFGTGTNATITVNGIPFNISSDAENKFFFNLKAIIKAIINKNEFNDTITLNETVTLDNTLSRSVEVRFTIDNGETTVKSLTFLKSAYQIGSATKSNTLRVMLPSTSLTYFDGLPMDFSVYSNVSQSISGLQLREGVNRISVADLSFPECSETEILGVKIKKLPKAKGHYLKWFNQSGGWSYWRCG